MSESKIETATGMCIIALTRHIMKKENLNYEVSYRKLLSTELYKLLLDSETGLFLEMNEYLCEAYDEEIRSGRDGLYEYVNKDI